MQNQRAFARRIILFGLIAVTLFAGCSSDNTSETPIRSDAVEPTQKDTDQVAVISTAAPITMRGKDPVDTFADGQWDVGVHILPGTYTMLEPAERCHWERVLAWSVCSSDIIESGDVVNDIGFVSITNADMGFSSEGCGTWVRIGDIE